MLKMNKLEKLKQKIRADIKTYNLKYVDTGNIEHYETANKLKQLLKKIIDCEIQSHNISQEQFVQYVRSQFDLPF